MTLIFAQLLTTLCCCSPTALQDDRKELVLIQGTWLVQRIEENGGRWDKEKEQWTITITGADFKLEDQNKAILEGSLTVDGTEKLKKFNAGVRVSPTQTISVVGIYKL